MDARITKQRLGILLSYDWIKILATIVAAVVALVLFFTFVGARPTLAQTFTVYAYLDVVQGEDHITLADRIGEGVFSYDILFTNVESFYRNPYADAAFNARRSSGDGTVLFITDYSEEEGGGTLTGLAAGIEEQGLLFDENGNIQFFYDPMVFLSDAESYLVGFFGEDWKNGELDTEKSDACFEARNGKDARYRSEKSKEEGKLSERERLEKLRRDLLFVEDAFAQEKLVYACYRSEEYGELCVAVGLKKLPSIKKLYYYTDAEGNTSAEQLDLVILQNGDALGDLRFETVSFLRFLVETYGV